MLQSFHRPRHEVPSHAAGEDRSLTAMERTAEVILPIAHRLRNNQSQFPSPLVMDWLYQSAVIFTNLEQANFPFYRDCVKCVREAMENLTSLWPVGSKNSPPFVLYQRWRTWQTSISILLKRENWLTCNKRFVIRLFLASTPWHITCRSVHRTSLCLLT